MNRLCRIAASSIFLLLAASNVSAQMGMRMGPPDVRGVWNPTMGAGAGYEMQSETSEKTNMEFAIVGKESVGGKDAYWFEITMNSPKSGGEMVMKYLYAMDGGNLQVAGPPAELEGLDPAAFVADDDARKLFVDFGLGHGMAEFSTTPPQMLV